MSRQNLTLAVLLVLATPGALAQSTPGATPSVSERIRAAEQKTENLQRAMNLARNTAIALNGGLGVYQPGLCMTEARRVAECLLSRGNEGFVFRFLGGPPGWVVEQQPATVETEIRIAADGRSVLKTLYNGAPQRARGTTSGGTCPCVCPVKAR